MKRSIVLISILLVCGCMVQQPSSKRPTDEKPDKQDSAVKSEANAADCLAEFGLSLSKVFAECADAAEADEPALSIAEQMGDKQKAGRVKAFMPLMAELGEAEDNAAMAVLLRKWSKQLETNRGRR